MTGIIIGSIVGAATALLMAPKSGKELRDDINHQVGTLKEKSGEWKETVMEKGTEITTTAKEKTDQLRQVAMEKGSNVTEMVKDKAEQLRGNDSNNSNQDQGNNDGWKVTTNEAADGVKEMADQLASESDQSTEEIAEKADQMAKQINNSMNE